MIKIIKSFYKTEQNFDAFAEHFFFHHPCLGFFTVFIGLPIFILATVTISTIVIMLLGWL